MKGEIVQNFGLKIQDFIQTLFQNKNFFFQTQGYQTGDCMLQTYGQD